MSKSWNVKPWTVKFHLTEDELRRLRTLLFNAIGPALGNPDTKQATFDCDLITKAGYDLGEAIDGPAVTPCDVAESLRLFSVGDCHDIRSLVLATSPGKALEIMKGEGSVHPSTDVEEVEMKEGRVCGIEYDRLPDIPWPE